MVWLCKNGHEQKQMKIDKDLCKCKICGEPMYWFTVREGNRVVEHDK